MDKEINNKQPSNQKIIIGILAILLVGLGIFSGALYSEKNENEQILTKEKQQVLADLNALTLQYDEVIADNKIVNDDLIDARERIDNLLDSLTNSQSSVKDLIGYKNLYIKLKKEKELLFEENERLRIENTYLTASLDSTSIQLYETKLFSDALLDQNKTLTDVVKNASYLQVLGLDAVGVIERSSGKLIPTERARRSDKLKVCFMIAKNDLVESGDMELYVQVIDPKNNVLGLNNELVFNEDVLNYSLISSFNYENNNLDICEYISSDEKFETGNYTVNIFNKNTLLSSTSLTLK
jgi:regulator of replication initiation timing